MEKIGNTTKLILASNSSRRRDIMSEAGYIFDIKASNYNEKSEFDPVSTAENNALGKARDVFSRFSDCVVLGADTVVSIDGKILGKPMDKEDAKSMLKFLSGKRHCVVTGYAVVWKGGEICSSDISEVTFNVLSCELIERYVDSGSPLDKAGAYGIQDPFPIVADYTGSIKNIIGLPIEKIKPLLDKILDL